MGAQKIYDNQNRRSPPPRLKTKIMCPHHKSDMLEFHCNSVVVYD
jgi:hypothetical protein